MGEDQISFFPILTQDCSTAPFIIHRIILSTVAEAKSLGVSFQLLHMAHTRGWRAAPLHITTDEPEETSEILSPPQPLVLVYILY